MISALKKLVRAKPTVSGPSVPEGTRYYAIGDIHGCNTHFEALIEAIEEDALSAPDLETRIVLLGDLVDRGPDSAKVIANARNWQERRNVQILAGNHEEMFLQSFNDTKVLRHFIRHGGRETILSYGVPQKKYNKASLDELQALIHEYVSEQDRAFIASFSEMVVAGDYVFVHAGIKPGIELEAQSREDLLWIRERFLDYDEAHPLFVVHGHTIVEKIDRRTNRIGIDTGAFRYGKLTALVLEGSSRRVIQALGDGETIEIRKKDL
ncbi:MAG: serine/threonine protein phosphatase [Erythrobacter sp.]|nr:serine/threonine protein phosphatase [Erythrobacter sp.]RZV34953.1 MAG: serine/threonine protein phosphatase [Sphingomonadaceae bacterium]